MLRRPINLACVNLDTSNFHDNLARALDLIEAAYAAGAEWIQLPEAFLHLGGEQPLESLLAEVESALDALRSTAKKLGVVLFAGTVPSKGSDAKVYNTLHVIGREGQIIVSYHKTHLFKLNDEKNQPIHDEGKTYLAGNKLVSFELEGYHVGLSICYDLRFSGLYAKLSQKAPLDVIACPSAFTLKTGKDHWELLLRARAVEFQSYVFAANMTGKHSQDKESYGHSMIIDPWGHKRADSGEKPGLALARLDPKELHDIRKTLPTRKHLRPDLYL